MSVKTLVIVESPAKCNKIGGFLGPNYIVKASFGHIRGIIDGLKAIDFTNDYRIKYIINKFNESYLDEFTIESVSLEAGFTSKSGFYKSFRKLYQTTPSEYFSRLKSN